MTNVISNLFGSSPVMPLEKHVALVSDCAARLKPLFAAVVAGDWAAAGSAHAEIERLEIEADDLKKSIRLHLPRSLFMPVARQDILELLLVQDRIADRTRDVSGLVVSRQMEIPSAIVDDFLSFVDCVIESANVARESVHELDELYTSAFRGAEAALVEGLIDKLDAIESETDRRQVAINKILFGIEGTLDPINAMVLYRVIEQTGDVADMCERVGRRLEVLLSH